jgi:YVTN family beta-propeller protein
MGGCSETVAPTQMWDTYDLSVVLYSDKNPIFWRIYFMRAVKKSLFKDLFLTVILVSFVFVGAACSASTASNDGNTNHEHEEGQANNHGHDDEGDGQYDQGTTTIGGEEAKIDHHGNPVFDEEERVYEQYIQDGVSVEFTIENFLGVGGRGGELAPRIVEGQHAVLQFNLTDAESGAPLNGYRPAVWLDLVKGELNEDICKAQVQGYLGGTLDSRPMIDLNSYFILSMNKDNTISVIDPMVDVAGMTNLFAIILLQGTPQDWAITEDHLQLFVTMPELNKVAIVDLDGFQVVANVEVEGHPNRVSIQPDGRYAWVEIDSEKRRESGVAVIDVANRSLVDQIPTGKGEHSIAFSPDSRYAYVANKDDGTLTIIDTDSLDKVKNLDVGKQPVSVAVSAASGMVYVADQAEGVISVVDDDRLEISAQLPAERGLTKVDISPDGKWGFAISQGAETIFLIDTQNDLVTHAMQVRGGPDQISFTDSAAYIRSSTSAAVFMIPFDEIDPLGDVSLLTIPVGVMPPNSSEATSLAKAILPIPGGDAVLIANPADDKIYFYVEGAQSPAGGYQGHTLVPRAVQVVDRSLKERSPGVYTGGIRIPQSGDFSVAFLLDDPDVLHCFTFSAKPNQDSANAENAKNLLLEFLNENQPKAGETFKLKLKLSDEETGEPVSEVEDLVVLARVLAGNWNQRLAAIHVGEGMYEVELTFPNPGMYNLFFSVPSLGISFDLLPQRTLQVGK